MSSLVLLKFAENVGDLAAHALLAAAQAVDNFGVGAWTDVCGVVCVSLPVPTLPGQVVSDRVTIADIMRQAAIWPLVSLYPVSSELTRLRLGGVGDCPC